MTSGGVRVALVHDYLLIMRGAERSFMALCDIWPDASVHALLYDPAAFDIRLAGRPVRTSPLQRLGASQATFKALMPLMPMAVGRLDVSGVDVVVSSSSAFAHGVRPDSGVPHVCYCYTPFRYAWYEQERGVSQAPRLLRPAVRNSLYRIRRWDRKMAARGTHYVAISALSQERIALYWGVEAPIVYPPVELSRFAVGEPQDFFLVVAELVRHKQVDIALEAARRAGVPIKVVGGGADEPRLRALYGDSAEFMGRIGDDPLAALYAQARALVVPNAEEFGITAVEAQASGRPVLAAAAGGALETVRDGETGLLLPPGDVGSLAAAMTDPVIDRFSPVLAVENARRFSVAAFQDRIQEQVQRALRLG